MTDAAYREQLPARARVRYKLKTGLRLTTRAFHQFSCARN
jgi:hypothetical protein